MSERPNPNALIWLILSVVVIGLDQWTKAWVLSSLPEYTAIPVIEGFWNWYRTYNTGAAFSFLSNAGGWQLWFFRSWPSPSAACWRCGCRVPRVVTGARRCRSRW